MSIDITITQKGLLKKALPLPVILGKDLQYGALEGERLEPGKLGEADLIAYLPEAIGRGLGTQLFDVLEGDEWCRDAHRIWLTSSVNALDFYEKRGYVNPCGYRTRGEDGLLTMEIRK